VADAAATGKIVVGVDGSAASKAALRWAVAQARLTGSEVEAVIAWHPLIVFGMALPMGDDFDVEGTAQTVLRDTVTEVLTDEENAVKVREVMQEGLAAGVLIDAACDVQLLVVGTRGHAGFAETLLGSVAQYCVHHSTCPVVIVRGRTE
jgi:nucleotide-binding universal stress UspA family protein